MNEDKLVKYFLPEICGTKDDKEKLYVIFYKTQDFIEDYILIQYFIVFSDEIHPNYAINNLYKKGRIKKYGSEKDISPIYVIYPKISEKKHCNVFFEDSLNQPYDIFIPNHIICRKKISKIDKIQFIVSTWNHLFLTSEQYEKNNEKKTELGKLYRCSPEIKKIEWKFEIEENFYNRFPYFDDKIINFLFRRGLLWSKEISENLTAIYRSKNPFLKELIKKLKLQYGFKNSNELRTLEKITEEDEVKLLKLI